MDLHWLPHGAGAHVVRVSGRIYEGLSAVVQRRAPCDIYHSALEITLPSDRFVVEVTPVPDAQGGRRGVVGEGAVAIRWIGRFRLFRYEVRRWPGGVIPDVESAVSTVTVAEDEACALRILRLVPSVPMLVWGRDEIRAGDMWNSNSVTSWLLACAGVDVAAIGPPPGGRAPGWHAGLVAAARRPVAEPGAQPRSTAASMSSTR